MASAPQAQLPLFYNDLMPLNSRDHGTWRARTVDKASWIGNQHAIPLTVDEPVPVMPQILISLGAQSERPFYKARMAYRARGGPLPGLIAQTGQLFTHSALPPYMACREGEPSLAEAMAARPLPLTLHPVASVQRDLSYASGLLEELRAAGAFVN